MGAAGAGAAVASVGSGGFLAVSPRGKQVPDGPQQPCWAEGLPAILRPLHTGGGERPCVLGRGPARVRATAPAPFRGSFRRANQGAFQVRPACPRPAVVPTA